MGFTHRRKTYQDTLNPGRGQARLKEDIYHDLTSREAEKIMKLEG